MLLSIVTCHTPRTHPWQLPFYGGLAHSAVSLALRARHGHSDPRPMPWCCAPQLPRQFGAGEHVVVPGDRTKRTADILPPQDVRRPGILSGWSACESLWPGLVCVVTRTAESCVARAPPSRPCLWHSPCPRAGGEIRILRPGVDRHVALTRAFDTIQPSDHCPLPSLGPCHQLYGGMVAGIRWFVP
jgi:hypothetical protein